MMTRYFLFLLLPLCFFADELEVRLSTRSPLKPLYLGTPQVPRSEYDWRYYDELRNVFAFDLNVNGFTSVLTSQSALDEKLNHPDIRSHFDVPFWKKEKIPYVISLHVFQNQLEVIVFDIEKESSKKYPTLPLTGKIENDRKGIHQISDAIQKDLFGIEGIASLSILYALREKTADGWSSEIWMCDADGANGKKILTDKGYCLSPGFFPSKQDFFYVSYQEGQSKIYRASLTQPKGEPLISLRGSQALPAINRKGTQMAFITDIAGRPDLFIQNFDSKGKMLGKARQLYSSPRATQASPTFSPDGKKIAFVSDKDGPPRIYILDIPSPKETNRPRPHLITQKNRENTCPAWSPDGKKLAYSAKVDGVRQIWIYDFETQEEWPLTTGPENKENPSWAPDNLHLIYNTETEETSEIYLVHLNQGEPVLISQGSAQKRFPCWQTCTEFRHRID